MGRKAQALRGVTDAEAIRLYNESAAELEARGQLNAATREMLRCAAQWTQEAGEAQRRILALRREPDSDGKLAARIRTLMRCKALAEGERGKIFDDLLLTPQRPRGRPPKEGAPEEEEEDDGGWSAFDEGGDGG